MNYKSEKNFRITNHVLWIRINAIKSWQIEDLKFTFLYVSPERTQGVALKPIISAQCQIVQLALSSKPFGKIFWCIEVLETHQMHQPGYECGFIPLKLVNGMEIKSLRSISH